MNTLSKIMATTAVCTLFAGGALAQSAEVGTGVGVGADVGTQDLGAESAVEGSVEGTVGATTQADGTIGTDATTGVDATTGAATATGVAPAPETQPQQAQPQPAEPQPPLQAQPAPAQPAPGAAPAHSDAVAMSTQAIERGEAVVVVSTDGRVLGEVAEASQDERGAAQLSITLDGALETTAQRVTFVGLAQVDGEGRIVVPMASEEFISQVQAQTGGQG